MVINCWDKAYRQINAASKHRLGRDDAYSRTGGIFIRDTAGDTAYSLWFNEVWPCFIESQWICRIPSRIPNENASRTGVRILPNGIKSTSFHPHYLFKQLLVRRFQIVTVLYLQLHKFQSYAEGIDNIFAHKIICKMLTQICLIQKKCTFC